MVVCSAAVFIRAASAPSPVQRLARRFLVSPKIARGWIKIVDGASRLFMKRTPLTYSLRTLESSCAIHTPPAMDSQKPHHDAQYYKWLLNCEEVEPFRLRESSRYSINQIWKQWTRFCKLGRVDPLTRLQIIDIRDIRVFMRWYLDKHKMRQLDSLFVKMRYWRMVYTHKLGVRVNVTLASQMKEV